jgi:glucokinase-like ROK family protein
MSEASFFGSNINRVKTHNMQAVLLSLLFQEKAFRVNIAKELSLSTTTITNIIDELSGMGLVTEDGIEEVGGRRKVGRPRAALRLIKDARYAVGVQIGVERYHIALANLKAEILVNKTFSFDRKTDPEVVFQRICQQIEDLILERRLDRQRVIGVGVGAAGLVNYLSGVNLLSANMGWENVPIRDLLASGLHLPVVVDNNVKAMALGEAFFGAGRNAGSLAFVYGSTGVGSGLVIGSRLLHGADLGAGEIGHMILIANGGEKCRCGRCGCLETLVSEPAMIQHAEALVKEHPDSWLARNWATEVSSPIETIFEAARRGDPDGLDLINRAAHYLGIALANLVNLLNPEMIVLGGLFAQGQDLILPAAQKTLEETAFAGLGKKVNLQATSFGWQAGIVGSAALALTNFFYLNAEEQAVSFFAQNLPR